MGKTTEGKFWIHFEGESYTNDKFLMESELRRYCKLPNKIGMITEDKKTHTELLGLPNGRVVGFFNSILIILMNNKALKSQLSLLNDKKEEMFIQVLSETYHRLSKKSKISTSIVPSMM